MGKNLYSLILSDEVIRAVDVAAHRSGISRSALVNHILAEYVSVPTPESRISSIFAEIEQLVSASDALVPFFAPNSSSMSLKSSLAYKYRPTVKYEVDMNTAEGENLGALLVILRTQSQGLINEVASFFRLWVRVENVHLAPLLNSSLSCELYDGKFVRPIAIPRANCTADEIAAAISDYIVLLDNELKGYLGGKLSEADIERDYLINLQSRNIYI